jgi:transposase
MRILNFIQQKERAMKNITVIGIDIAKNFMQVHGTDARGKVLLKKRLSRDKFITFMANVPVCLVGMEACGGAHYWAEQLVKLGFIVKLMSPRKVKKFVENHKNDAKDAAACAEAVCRADMTFIPIKTKEQLEIQMLHRARSYYIKQRTGLMNVMRGLLLELGVAIPKGQSALMKKVQGLLDTDCAVLNESIKKLYEHFNESVKHLNKEVEDFTQQIEAQVKENDACKRILTIAGIGPLSASALIAKIGNGSEFKNGRELAAYLGLVPKQYSSGETQRLGRISKHGDRYLRQLLVHGGRSSLTAAKRKDKLLNTFIKQDAHSVWMRNLADRIGMNRASVAVANKNARMVISLLKNKTLFDPQQAH